MGFLTASGGIGSYLIHEEILAKVKEIKVKQGIVLSSDASKKVKN